MIQPDPARNRFQLNWGHETEKAWKRGPWGELIPGCISQGKDEPEALANIREAIALCIETQPTEGWTLPPEYHVVDVDVAA